MSCLQSSKSLLMDMQLLLLRRGPSRIETRIKTTAFSISKQASVSIQFLFLLLNVTSFNTTLIPRPQYELLKTPKPFQSFKTFCLWWVIHTINISFERTRGIPPAAHQRDQKPLVSVAVNLALCINLLHFLLHVYDTQQLKLFRISSHNLWIKFR